MKRKILNVTVMIFILLPFIFPVSAMASDADGAQYEMRCWRFNYVGNNGGIVIGYVGKDGVNLSTSFGFHQDIYAGHENDPAWTGFNSAYPFLAYIKKHGIDSNMKRVFDVTCYDPGILKALEGQGVSLSQLGGSSNPVAGPTIFPVNGYKNVVGIGIPASQTSTSQQETPTSTQTSKSTSYSNSSTTSNAPTSSSATTSAQSQPTETQQTPEQIVEAMQPELKKQMEEVEKSVLANSNAVSNQANKPEAPTLKLGLWQRVASWFSIMLAKLLSIF